jgi:hypothetical protein
MTQIGDITEAKMQITGITGVQDREGRPQWEFKARFEWTPEKSQFGDTMYVHRDKFPDWGVDTKGEVWVEVMAAEIKPQSAKYQADTGETHFRGDRDWHWKWVAIKTLDHEPAPYLPTPTFSTNATSTTTAVGNSGQTDWGAQRSQQIAWNSAYNNAVQLYSKEHTPNTNIDYARIRSIALTIYAEIIAGPPQTEAEPAYPNAPEMGSDAPEMAIQAVSPPQPQTTTAPAPTRPQRPPPKCSPGKLNELKETMKAMGCERDDVIKYCCDNFDERGPDDLVDAEVDRLTEAVLAGQITGAW